MFGLRSSPFVFSAVLLASSLLSSAARAAGDDPDADYDRLDGRGPSGKKVDVIEWQGNLEIHVYPGGSTRGLALRIDDRDPKKRVMVIGYRFDTNPRELLVRRNILSIPLEPGFKVFRDPRSGREYDKFVVTHSRPASPLAAYALEPGPSQLYPDGHPALAAGKDDAPSSRRPASQDVESGLDPETGSVRFRNW